MLKSQVNLSAPYLPAAVIGLMRSTSYFALAQPTNSYYNWAEALSVAFTCQKDSAQKTADTET